MSKTCIDCPSYLTVEESAGHFRRNIDSPMCARFARPLAAPLNPKAHPELTFASDCEAYGLFRPTEPINWNGLTIGAPDPDHMEYSDEEAWAFKNCQRCSQCVHFVDEDTVTAELGFSAGMCKAKGRLIPSIRASAEARDCEYRFLGPNAKDTEGVLLWPAYEQYKPVVTPIDVFFDATKADKVFEDPTSYETDKPVAPEHQAIGIKAWRRIADPEEPKRYTYLPIFDSNHFPEEERVKIPRSGDDEHPELYLDHMGLLYTVAVLWQELDETPTLWGEAGTGKTELARHMAWIMGLPFERISITRSTELDDIAGKILYDPEQGTYFHPGRIPQAWAKPCVVLVDEPNTGPPDVWHFLRPLTDNSRQLVLDVDKGQRIVRDDNTYLALAMNPAWDPRNRGAEEIADADVSRLSHIYLTLPPRDIEERIIRDRVKLDGWDIDFDTLNMVMNIANELRGLSREGTIPISWGLRPQIQVARQLRWFSPVRAYRVAAGDFMETEAQDAMLDIVRAHADRI